MKYQALCQQKVSIKSFIKTEVLRDLFYKKQGKESLRITIVDFCLFIVRSFIQRAQSEVLPGKTTGYLYM